MKINSKTRRQFLVGSAKTMVALPFLPSLMPRTAWAQSAPVQKRFIAAWVPLGGYANSDMYPTYQADIRTNLYPGQDIHHTNLRLSPGRNAISHILNSRLNPFLPKLNLLRGIDLPVPFSHAEGCFLGQYRHVRGANRRNPDAITGDTQEGYPALPYIDQFLAYHPNFYQTPPVVRSAIGYSFSSLGQVNPNVKGSGLRHVGGISSPHDLFNALFGVSTPQVGGGSGPSPNQVNQTTLIDHVLADLNATMRHRNISSTDKLRLDSFTTELHELQARLSASTSTAACSQPSDPVIDTPMADIESDMDREAFLDLYTGVLAAGIKCGRTSIGCMKGPMQVATQGRYTYDNFHGWGHEGHSDRSGNAIRWMVEKMYVPLLEKLDTPEADGRTFLDNSIVMFGSENSEGFHRGWDLPILLAGDAGGFLKTGYFCDYRQRGVSTNYGQPGILHNQLMMTILQAMGVPSNDPILQDFAYAEQVMAPATQGFWNTLRRDNGEHPHRYCIRDANKPLPIIT
jgi:hypothetical protein